MNRRDFIKRGAGWLGLLSIGGLEVLLNSACKCFVPKPATTERALWLHPRELEDGTLGLDFEQLNPYALDFFKINTVYLGYTHRLLVQFPLQDFKEKMERFVYDCSERNIKVYAVGFENAVKNKKYPFLKYKNKDLKEQFNQWIEKSKELFPVYQTDFEVHVEPGFHSENEEEDLKTKKAIFERYLEICTLFKDIADKNSVEFSPIVSLIKKNNYNAILKRIGRKGLNDIPCHYLTVMAYTKTLDELKDYIQLNLSDANKPVLIGVSCHSDHGSPFLSFLDLLQVPKIIDDFQKQNRFIRGYVIHSNRGFPNDLPN